MDPGKFNISDLPSALRGTLDLSGKRNEIFEGQTTIGAAIMFASAA
jgi:hypothetical protein